jgi:hypothetical protein
MLDIHVQLCSIGSLNVVGIIGADLICLVYASHHCNQAKLKSSIGAVPLMYILMQNHGIQPLLVEHGFADICLKGSEKKRTHSSPLDVLRQYLPHTVD